MNTKKVWKAYDDAVKRLLAAALPAPGQEWPFDGIADAVIDACEGMGWGAWIEMDERSGYRDLGRLFAFVRQTRNSPQHGPRLAKAINRRVKGRAHA